MRTYFKDKVILIVMLIWLLGIHITFEIIYLQLVNVEYTSYLYPIRFFLYLMFIHYPIMHRMMTILEKYYSHNVLLGLGKIVLDVYFILLFVNLFYCNKIILGLKWFCLISFTVYSINFIKEMQKELSISKTDLDNGLTFQLTCIEYWILMVSICSFGNNKLSQILSVLFLTASMILRGISLYDNQKTNCSLKHIVIKFVFAALIEWIAFILFFIGVPFDDLHMFFTELYGDKTTIYIDMLGLLIVCCLLEFPMHHINILLDKSKSLHEARDKVINYAKEHEVDKSVVMTVAGATNCKLDYNALDKKGDADMCTVFEENRLEGKIEGKIEGIIKMLKKYNESDDNILEELMSELDISKDVAEEYLDKYNKGIL